MYYKVISDRQIEIDVEPDVVVDGAEPCESAVLTSSSKPNSYKGAEESQAEINSQLH